MPPENTRIQESHRSCRGPPKNDEMSVKVTVKGASPLLGFAVKFGTTGAGSPETVCIIRPSIRKRIIR
jgi:hypothetical protein